MEQLKPWYVLDIDISNAIRDDFNFDKLLENLEYFNSDVGMFVIPKENINTIFTDAWLDYMKQQQLNVGRCLIFYRKPFYTHPDAHIDGLKDSPAGVYALNWIIDPEDDSEMIWYDFPTSPGVAADTPADTPYVSWPTGAFADQTPITRRIKNQLTLVRVGIPHNVIMGEKTRWCISVRFPMYSNDITNWEDAVNFFKPWIIE
jgi:hypothetical protein